jgi:hypothetical protein
MPAAALSLRCADWRRYDAPRFTAVSPTSGKTAAGTRVSVTGRAFTGVRAVKFGAASGISIRVLSSTKLLVTAPAHVAEHVDVRGRDWPRRASSGSLYLRPPAGRHGSVADIGQDRGRHPGDRHRRRLQPCRVGEVRYRVRHLAPGRSGPAARHATATPTAIAGPRRRARQSPAQPAQTADRARVPMREGSRSRRIGFRCEYIP